MSRSRKRDQLHLLKNFYASDSVITSGCISKTSTLIATGGDDGRAHVWNIDGLGLGATDVDDAPKLILEGTGSQLDTISFDTQETYIAGGTEGGAIHVWDMNSSQPLRTMAGHRSNVTALHFHPFGKYFTSGSQDCNLKLWDVRKKGTIQTYKGHTAPITSVRHSPDGRWVFSGDADGNVKVWDISSAKFLLGFQAAASPAGRRGANAAVTSMVFHPVEFLLAIACNERQLSFWDVEKFVPLEMSPMQSSPIHSLNFYGETGHALVVASTDNVRAWTWEPITCHSSVEAPWGKLLDTSIDPVSDSLLGLSCYHNVVSLYQLGMGALDLTEAAPTTVPNDIDSVAIPERSLLSPPEVKANTASNTDMSSMSRIPPSANSVSALDAYSAMQLLPSPSQSQTDLSSHPKPQTQPSSQPQSQLSSPQSSQGGSSQQSSILPQSTAPTTNAVPVQRGPRTGLRNQTSANFPLQVNYSVAPPNPRPQPQSVSQSQSQLSNATNQDQALAHALNQQLNIRNEAESVATEMPHIASTNVEARAIPRSLPVASQSHDVVPATPVQHQAPPHHESRTDGVSATSGVTSNITSVPTRLRPSPQPLATSTSSTAESVTPANSHTEPSHITQPNVSGHRALPRDPLQGTIVPVSAVVTDRAQPLGLDPSAFLPPAVDSASLSASPVIDPEATRQAVMEHHAVMATVVHRRLQNIRVLKTFWGRSNVRGALEALERMQDPAVCFDFLMAVEKPLMDPRSALQLTLDTSVPLLAVLNRMLRSRVETHALLALRYLLFLLRAFSERILATLAAAAQGDSALGGAGIDLVQEERIDKCIKLFEAFKDSSAALTIAAQTHAGVRAKSPEAVSLLESLLGTSEE